MFASPIFHLDHQGRIEEFFHGRVFDFFSVHGEISPCWGPLTLWKGAAEPHSTPPLPGIRLCGPDHTLFS